MSAYIHRYCTISPIDSIESGILGSISGERLPKDLIEPNYKEIIPGSLLRRMSKIIRLGVGAALNAAKGREIGGIIVGSGIGCYDNSIEFSKEYFNSTTESLYPAAFIQSTDNTIAGQIALILKNNAYNITYIHKGIAFENALIDALMLVGETDMDILTGAVDEWIQIFEMKDEIRENHPGYWIGEGSSFFILNRKAEGALAKISTCWTIQATHDNLAERITTFLEQSGLVKPDLILYGNSFINRDPVSENILGVRTIDYSAYSGIYFTNSAFGTQLAVEMLSRRVMAEAQGIVAERILVVNNFYDRDWGLIYLSAI